MWASLEERDERFRAETSTHRPADPGDVRFEYGTFEDGMEETPYWLLMIGDDGEVIETHHFATSEEIFSLIGSFRECQGSTLEERLAPFGLEWEREQYERMHGGW